MIRRALLLITLTLSFAVSADQSLIDRLHEAESKYNLPHNSLVALSKTESSMHWFALNIDGAAFYPETKEKALRIMQHVVQRPYVLKLRSRTNEAAAELFFFPSEDHAQRILNRVLAGQTDKEAVRHSDKSYLRRLDLLNTGMCALQLNYRYQAHGQGRGVQTLLDPEFCVNHGAKFFAGLINKHGFGEKGIGCYYTCGSSKRAQRIRRDYFARYSRHLKRLNNSTSLASR